MLRASTAVAAAIALRRSVHGGAAAWAARHLRDSVEAAAGCDILTFGNPATACRSHRPPHWRQFSSGGGGGGGDGGSASTAVLSNTSTFLRNLSNGAEIFLVGTAHVSKQSAEEVRDMIRLVKPSSVMVELCPQRAARLRAGPAHEANYMQQMLKQIMFGGGSFSEKMVQMSLPMMYKMMKMLGMEPGGEFKAALEEADACGARVVYGDRNVQATLQRLSQNMDLQQLLQMATGRGLPEPPASLLEAFRSGGGEGIEAQVEGMKSRRLVRDMCEYMRAVNPGLAKALIDERDEIMAQALLRLEGRAVGVVGLAHLDGIERRWEQLQLSGRALTAG